MENHVKLPLFVFIIINSFICITGQSTYDNVSLFDAAYDYPVDYGPNSLTTTDVNGDGFLDLIVSSSMSSGIAKSIIYSGKANGTFQLWGVFPYSVLCVDFDNDEKVDMLLSRNDSLFFSKGNGDGTFQPVFNTMLLYGGKYTVKECFISDLNKDGKLDLALRVDSVDYHGVSVLLGNGNGTFQNPYKNQLVSCTNFAMSQGDFNNDGNSDIVLTIDGELSLLIGIGNGTFQIIPSFYSSAFATKDIKTNDFNHDGNYDLVTLSYGDSQGIHVFFGNGNGTFQSPKDFYGLVYDWSLEIADFNKDGNLDLAVPGCKILFGNGADSFDAGYKYGAGFGYSEGIVAGDFNSDGWPDLAVGTRESRGGCFSVILNKLDGTFYQLPTYEAGSENIISKDVNNDSYSDLIGVDFDGSVSILLGNSSGSFQLKSKFISGNNTTSVTSADFNKDGILDLALTNSGNGGSISIFSGVGDGTFNSTANLTGCSIPNSITSGDLDNDGNIDLAVSDVDINSGSVLIYKGNGDGTFQLENSYSGLGWAVITLLNRYCNWLTLGDFNKDGKLDIAATAYGQGHFIAIFLGNGNLTFQTPVYYGTGGYPSCIVTGDINEDGIIDIATADAGNDYISIFIGNGDGTFKPKISYKYAGLPVFLSLGDINGDKHQDIVAANVYSENITILYGKGDGTFENIQLYGKFIAKSIALGDFNWDGRNDIAVAKAPNTADADQISILINLLPRKIPKQINPVDESVINPENINFSWTPIDNAFNYHLQVSSNSLFNNFLYNDSQILSSSIQIDQFDNDKTYYWRVSAINIEGASDWSYSWSFTTNSVTGMNEITFSNKITIYPNPTNGVIDISINEPIESDYKVSVFNSTGSLLKTVLMQNNENAVHFDLSRYPSGFYFIKIETDKGIFQYKIVKE
jgi:hypothetical protein